MHKNSKDFGSKHGLDQIKKKKSRGHVSSTSFFFFGVGGERENQILTKHFLYTNMHHTHPSST